MENLEIIFENIKNEVLDKLIFQDVASETKNIIASHFYDNGRDVEFHEVMSLTQYFNNRGTGNMYVEKMNIGVTINNVMIIISFDEMYGDVVLNFKESEIVFGSINEQSEICKRIIDKMLSLYSSVGAGKLIMGYEPATDADMRIFTIDKDGIHIGENAHLNFAQEIKTYNQ